MKVDGTQTSMSSFTEVESISLQILESLFSHLVMVVETQSDTVGSGKHPCSSEVYPSNGLNSVGLHTSLCWPEQLSIID